MSADTWISIGVSGVISLLAMPIAPDWIKDSVATNPWAFFMWTAVISCWLFSIGYGIGKSRNDKTIKELKAQIAYMEKQRDDLEKELAGLKAEIAGLQAALENEKHKNAELASRMDARKEREREEVERVGRRKWVLGLNPDEKMMLLDVYEDDSKCTPIMFEHIFLDRLRECYPNIHRGVGYTTVYSKNYMYRWRFYLTDYGKLAAQENLDHLNEVKRLKEVTDSQKEELR